MNNLLEQLETLPDWQKYGFVGLLIVVIGVVYYYAVWAPNAEELEKLQRKIISLDGEIQKGMAMKDKERELEREVSLLDEQLKLALEILPDRAAMDLLIKSIENLAIEAGLSLDKFHPKPEIRKEFTGVIPVDLAVKGTYHSVGLFFEKLANEPRIVNVPSFDLKHFQGKRSFSLTGNIRVNAYYFIKTDQEG